MREADDEVCGKESTETLLERSTPNTIVDAAVGGGREREVVYWVNDESIINGKRGGYVPMIVQPICFRPEQTIKVDGGGVAFTLESREFKAPQCVVIRNELSESDRLFKPRSASR